MSPIAAMLAGRQGCAPRVSGDEPYAPTVIENGKECSPRQREYNHVAGYLILHSLIADGH